MIIDQMKNGTKYALGAAWGRALEFLMSLPSDSPDGEYPIQGEEIYARVMTYETRGPVNAALETHRRYVDVQIVLAGRERILWFPRQDLEVRVSYDEARDAEFYVFPSCEAARIDLVPGRFIVFFPQDGHMPSLIADKDPETVKKAVVKVKRELLFQPE